jgi:hypothetical protein
MCTLAEPVALTSHTMAVSSIDPENKNCELGDQHKSTTSLVCINSWVNCIQRRCSPSNFQMMMVPSTEADASMVPSGENRTQFTGFA